MPTATEPSTRSQGLRRRAGSFRQVAAAPRLSWLFGATVFVSAALLFCVQPMVARMVLPALGGTPAVWTTCMVFFQSVLLAGYACAHLSTTRLGIRAQAALQVILMLGSIALLPIGFQDASPAPGENPTLWLLTTLLVGVGLPFFTLATTAPLLQRWYARTSAVDASDPYFLYAASNAGSLIALLAYPIACEPLVGLSHQTQGWRLGYIVLATLLAACAAHVVKASSLGREKCVHAYEMDGESEWSWRRWWGWVGLAFVPSSWMLGVTAYLTSDVGALPLLWVLPLGLYLFSFVLVFSRRTAMSTGMSGSLLAAFLVMAVWSLAVGTSPGPGIMALHLAAFFAGALHCHGALAESRPSVRHLTRFYLAMSFGGVLGGIFNAIVAPLIFDRYVEDSLVIAASALALPASRREKPAGRAFLNDLSIACLAGVLAALSLMSARVIGANRQGAIVAELGVALASGFLLLKSRGLPARLALGVGAILLAGGVPRAGEGRVLLRDRSFFGALMVDEDAEGRFRRLVHGLTIHGRQSLDPSLAGEPLSYYHRTGPIGDVFRVLDDRTPSARIGVVGLGAGTLATYARPNDRMDFYEIDPAVVRVARDPALFRYLADSRASKLDVIVGDARCRLLESEPRSYDLLVLDAFSSDAIPVHLLTREALELDRRALKPRGLIAVHVSNRYLDLEPVLSAIAADLGWICRARDDLAVPISLLNEGKSASSWMLLAASAEDLGMIADDPEWRTPLPYPASRAWTDDYSDIVRTLRVFSSADE